MVQSKQSQIKLLIAKGKEQGYLTFAEVNDHLPQDIVDSDQIEDVIIESQEENDLIETSDSLAISIMKVLLVAVLVL